MASEKRRKRKPGRKKRASVIWTVHVDSSHWDGFDVGKMESLLNGHIGGCYTPPGSGGGPVSIFLQLANKEAGASKNTGTTYTYTVAYCPQWPCTGRG